MGAGLAVRDGAAVGDVRVGVGFAGTTLGAGAGLQAARASIATIKTGKKAVFIISLAWLLFCGPNRP